MQFHSDLLFKRTSIHMEFDDSVALLVLTSNQSSSPEFLSNQKICITISARGREQHMTVVFHTSKSFAGYDYEMTVARKMQTSCLFINHL